MPLKKGSNNTRTTIVSIIILDIILMTLFITFSDIILKDFSSSSSLSKILISGFAIVIPGTLFILIIFQFTNLFKTRNRPGYSIKKNVVLYYTVATILIVVPQTIISINFINAATDNWLNKDIKRSIDIGLDVMIDHYNSRVNELENLGKSSIYNNLLKNAYINRNIPFSEFKKLNSSIDLISFYSINGEPLYLLGDKKLKQNNLILKKDNHLSPLLEGGDYLVYQYKLANKYIIVLTSRLNKNFSENAKMLTKSQENLSQIDPHKSTFNFGILIYYTFFSIPLILLAILGSFIFSDEIIKPIRDIEDAINSVSKGNYSYRILSKKRNEFNLLIKSFNNMIKEIETSRTKLKHTEQISTWQDIATRLAHEIRNPLTPIKLSAQRVMLKTPDEDRVNKRYMQTIITEVTRMEKLLTEFRDFARFPQLNLKKAGILKIINNCIYLYREKYTNVTFRVLTNEDYELLIDEDQINQAISNLIINGIHATDEKGNIDISIKKIIKKGQDYCRLSIKDYGHGIAPENLKNIFKPYYTTKYNGSGLGLAIVNKIVMDHRGKIWIESSINKGTTFYIELPKDL